jgi:anti-sigma regulatory factor (Ser/Thr protein kinase)
VPTVALRFTPVPEHVRTARLVAVAVARRAGFSEGVLDEVRLAVGEACARAVRRSLVGGVDGQVEVALCDDEPGLDVVVSDEAGPDSAEDEALSLALVEGLADELELQDGTGGPGGRLRMTWRATTRR